MLGVGNVGAWQLRGRISVIPGGHSWPASMRVPWLAPPGCATATAGTNNSEATINGRRTRSPESIRPTVERAEYREPVAVARRSRCRHLVRTIGREGTHPPDDPDATSCLLPPAHP